MCYRPESSIFKNSARYFGPIRRDDYRNTAILKRGLVTSLVKIRIHFLFLTSLCLGSSMFDLAVWTSTLTRGEPTWMFLVGGKAYGANG